MGVSGYKSKHVQVDIKKPIRYVSIKIFAGVWIDGIRFQDDDENYLANQTWHDLSNLKEGASKWSQRFEVP